MDQRSPVPLSLWKIHHLSRPYFLLSKVSSLLGKSKRNTKGQKNICVLFQQIKTMMKNGERLEEG
jgi:hypothetical protein